MSRRTISLLLVAAALFSACVLYILTPHGIGLGFDSAIYLDAAQNLWIHHRFATTMPDGSLFPLTHYPPLFPLFLVIGKITAGSWIAGARFINAVFFGLNIALMGLLLLAFGGVPLAGAILAMMIASLSVAMLSVHTMALSEPLGLFFGFLGFGFLLRPLKNHPRLHLAIAAICFALASLARYANVTFLVTSLGYMPWCRIRDHKYSHFLTGMAFSLLGFAPMALLFLRNYLLTGNAFHRSVYFHPQTLLAALRQMVRTLAVWVCQSSELGRPCAVIAVIIVISVIVIPGRTELQRLLKFFIGVYLATLLFTLSWVDAGFHLVNLSPRRQETDNWFYQTFFLSVQGFHKLADDLKYM